MRSKLKYLILYALALPVISVAQDPIFSISDMDDIYLNPANSFNPFKDDAILNTNLKFRDQWNAIETGDTYSTSKIHGDANIYRSDVDAINGGLMFLSDRSNQGNLKNTSLFLQGSYTRKLTQGRKLDNSHFITVGSSFAFSQTNIDIEQFWFGRQYDLNANRLDLSIDSGEGFRNEMTSYKDLNVGARWMMVIDEERYAMAGFSISHLNSPEITSLNSNFNIEKRLLFQFEGSFRLSEIFNHKPGLLYVRQNPSWQIVPSYHISIDFSQEDNPVAIEFGLASRIVQTIDGVMMDALLAEIGLISKTWNFTFNFDVNTSSLKEYTNGNGSMELSLGYKIPTK